LTDTVLRVKISSGLTIDEYREGGSGDAGVDKADEFTLKTKAS